MMLDEKKIARWGFALAFISSLILTCHLLYHDKTSSATVGAVLTLSMGLFCFLPTMESFSAFGLSAQFRKNLSEANEMLSLVKAISESTIRSQMSTLAWGNRFGSPTLHTKRDQMSELNKALTSLNLPPEKVAEVQEPFIAITCYDIFVVYISKYRSISSIADSRWGTELHKARTLGRDHATISKLESRVEALRIKSDKAIHRLSSSDLLKLIASERMRINNLHPDDVDDGKKTELLEILAETENLSIDVIGAGNLTDPAIAYLKANGTRD